jgi:hypothetical protein
MIKKKSIYPANIDPNDMLTVRIILVVDVELQCQRSCEPT